MLVCCHGDDAVTRVMLFADDILFSDQAQFLHCELMGLFTLHVVLKHNLKSPVTPDGLTTTQHHQHFSHFPVTHHVFLFR